MSSTQQAKELKKRSAPKRDRGRWETLTDWARAQASVVTVPVARVLGQLLGLMLQAGVAVVFGLGYLRLGGWLLLIVAPIDALDGALARTLGKQSRFGAFLDSTLDRIADAVLILGLTTFYLRQGAGLPIALLLVSLVASMMVSYVRARAETLGFCCKVGLLTRMERILLIGLLSGLGLPMVMIWALAVLSVLTMLQRILHIYKLSRLEDGSG